MKWDTQDSEDEGGATQATAQTAGRAKPRRKSHQRPQGSDQIRQAFSKRKKGLVLKAYQLSALTDAKVFMFIVNDKGTSWAYATPGFGASLCPDLLSDLRILAAVPDSAKSMTEVMPDPVLGQPMSEAPLPERTRAHAADRASAPPPAAATGAAGRSRSSYSSWGSDGHPDNTAGPSSSGTALHQRLLQPGGLSPTLPQGSRMMSGDCTPADLAAAADAAAYSLHQPTGGMGSACYSSPIYQLLQQQASGQSSPAYAPGCDPHPLCSAMSPRSSGVPGDCAAGLPGEWGAQVQAQGLLAGGAWDSLVAQAQAQQQQQMSDQEFQEAQQLLHEQLLQHGADHDTAAVAAAEGLCLEVMQRSLAPLRVPPAEGATGPQQPWAVSAACGDAGAFGPPPPSSGSGPMAAAPGSVANAAQALMVGRRGGAADTPGASPTAALSQHMACGLAVASPMQSPHHPGAVGEQAAGAGDWAAAAPGDALPGADSLRPRQAAPLTDDIMADPIMTMLMEQPLGQLSAGAHLQHASLPPPSPGAAHRRLSIMEATLQQPAQPAAAAGSTAASPPCVLPPPSGSRSAPAAGSASHLVQMLQLIPSPPKSEAEKATWQMKVRSILSSLQPEQRLELAKLSEQQWMLAQTRDAAPGGASPLAAAAGTHAAAASVGSGGCGGARSKQRPGPSRLSSTSPALEEDGGGAATSAQPELPQVLLPGSGGPLLRAQSGGLGRSRSAALLQAELTGGGPASGCASPLKRSQPGSLSSLVGGVAAPACGSPLKRLCRAPSDAEQQPPGAPRQQWALPEPPSFAALLKAEQSLQQAGWAAGASLSEGLMRQGAGGGSCASIAMAASGDSLAALPGFAAGDAAATLPPAAAHT